MTDMALDTDAQSTADEKGRWLLVTGAINGLLAVALGAFGAHGLRHLADERMRSVFETAVDYHGWHALALFTTGLLADRYRNGWVQASGILFILGILMFSGSLYALTLGAPRWLGPVTPVGGVAFLAAWTLLAIGCWRGKR